MYPCYQKNIVSGAESFPLAWIIGENLLYLAMWILAGFLLWPVWTPFGFPLLTLAWVLLVVAIQVLLKKHNCSGCYYYNKWCHLGWGKISSAMFAQDSGDPKTGMRLALFYIIPPPLIFLLSIASAIMKGAAVAYWAALGLYVILNVTTFPIRKKGCGRCAMRETCPGSAVNTQQE
jgi:hypothetical protein